VQKYLSLFFLSLFEVTGANKGIGYAIVNKLCSVFDGIVYLTGKWVYYFIIKVFILQTVILECHYQMSVKLYRDKEKKKQTSRYSTSFALCQNNVISINS